MKNLYQKLVMWLFPFDDLIPKDLFVWITPQDELLGESLVNDNFVKQIAEWAEDEILYPSDINCRCSTL